MGNKNCGNCGKEPACRFASLKAAKISAPFLSDVELGRRFPTNETLVLIAQKIRASPGRLQEARPPLGLGRP